MTSGPHAAWLNAALDLATHGVPVMPLSADKRPVANCPRCSGPTPGVCGGRPNMKTAGPCQCPAPCHGWAAATADLAVVTSPAWARAWREAGAVAYHPGGAGTAGLTVVDLDNQSAVAWARETLPPTRTVATTRGEHWIYQGAMTSHNAVRPGVDLKSRMAYARWLGPGTGTMTILPNAVAELAPQVEETTPAPREGAGVVSSTTGTPWNRQVATGCRHTESYVRTGLERGLGLIRARREQGAGSQAFGVACWLANQHRDCPGPCGLDVLGRAVIAAAVSMGVPEPYATRAVTRGLNEMVGAV
ncbi:bifunctional DNA primase/polymerase [Streptomyces sp. NPDC049879]|uniref:bifunctional DNA primase/polymerase n=1 Tax=Streptomyces sp. NPDC049879 TaxID=3365598 RepID=UPI0037B5CFBC